VLKMFRMPQSFDELQRRSAALSANAKALREAGDEAQRRSAILKEMSRTTKDAAEECRRQADTARKRQGLRADGPGRTT
jgi:hypothetical protein